MVETECKLMSFRVAFATYEAQFKNKKVQITQDLLCF